MPRRALRRGTAAVRPPDPADVFATFLALLARLPASVPVRREPEQARRDARGEERP
jgi:hypothetical protein